MKKKRIIKQVVILLTIIIGLTVVATLLLVRERRKMGEQIDKKTQTFSIQLQEKENIINSKNNEINQMKINEHTNQHEKEILINENNELKKKQEELLRTNKKLENDIKNLRSNKTSSRSLNTSRSKNSNGWFDIQASAYCGCAKCCGKSTGKTASGTQATAGRTIAASSNFPFGTKIEIEGMGVYIVEDRGGAIKGNRIDIFFNSHRAALNFGRKKLKARIIQ